MSKTDTKQHSGKPGDKMEKRKQQERERIEKEEDEVAVDSDQSFPASDPPSWTGVTGPEVVDEDKNKKK